MLNIPSYIEDPNYRYRMPKLVAKVEGRGNGIKTNVVNMVDIATALKRPCSYPLKFFGNELGAQSNFSEKEQRAIVNGAHDQKVLQDLVDRFVEKFVLCYGCKLPEMDLYMQGKKGDMLAGKCNACGWDGLLDNTHKLCTFIKSHPPQIGKNQESTTKVKEKKVESDEEKKKKEKKKDKKKPKDSDDEKKKEKKKKEDKNRDSDDEANTKKEKEKKKKKDKKDKDKDKKEDKEDFVRMREEVGLDVEGIDQIINKLTVLSETASVKEFYSELRSHQLALGFDSQTRVVITMESLLGVECPTVKAFTNKYKHIKKCMGEPLTTFKALEGLQTYIFERCTGEEDKKKKVFQQIVAHMTQDGVLNDDAVLNYYENHENEAATFVAAKDAVGPVLDWIRSADESETSSSEESEHNFKALSYEKPKQDASPDTPPATIRDEKESAEVANTGLIGNEDEDINIDDI